LKINPFNLANPKPEKLTNSVLNLSPVNFNSVRIATIDPLSSQHAHVAQVLNNRYIRELRKETKRIVMGRKLKEFLEAEYTQEEIFKMPPSLRNLLRFSREITTSEIIKFLEYIDASHEITFRDFAFEGMKFRVLFEALGELKDVEMQAGENSYVSLSESFDLKKKIKKVFDSLRKKLSVN
jgi:hypothetical protein